MLNVFFKRLIQFTWLNFAPKISMIALSFMWKCLSRVNWLFDLFQRCYQGGEFRQFFVDKICHMLHLVSIKASVRHAKEKSSFCSLLQLKHSFSWRRNSSNESWNRLTNDEQRCCADTLKGWLIKILTSLWGGICPIHENKFIMLLEAMMRNRWHHFWLIT